MNLQAATNEYIIRVLQSAEDTRLRHGFGWRAARNAPASMAELKMEARLSKATGLPFRVSSRFSDHCIVPASINHAFRFWHDMTHLELDAGFDHSGEVLVGQHQLADFEQRGVAPHSIVWRLLFADTIAQGECLRQLSRFPADQARFTRDFLFEGLTYAIDQEAGRITHRREAA